jgi:TatD DNase family protein
LIDTHAHLDACPEPASELLRRAREAGVERVIAVGSGLDSCRETLAICEREEDVYAALGIHPHQAGAATQDDVAELWRLLADEHAVAVGETGLDYFRDYAPRERQLDLFRELASRAAGEGRPLVVHSREADEDTIGVLEPLADDVPVILHCFSSVGLLQAALARRWYVSFAGNVTYPKAAELRMAAAQVSSDRLLAETDSPYLAPQPVRGRPNEPAHVMHTLGILAEVRAQDVHELEREIEQNAARAFRLP